MMLARKTYWFSLTRRFGASRQGHAAIMFSIFAFPLIMAVGFALDFAQASKYRTELQNVADAVALAAVRGLPISSQTGEDDGRGLYEALMTDIRLGLISDNLKITFQTDPDYKAFVEIVAVAKGQFGNMIDLGTITFEVDATAILGRSGTEVALVLDLSGSMETARMKALGGALTTFDATINASPAAKDKLRIAVIPFAQNVTLPIFAADWVSTAAGRTFAQAQGRTCFATESRLSATSNATPSPRTWPIAPNYTTQCMTEQAFPLTQDFAQLRALATAFKNPPAWRADFNNAKGTAYWGTNLYTAAAWASRFLDAGWSGAMPAGAKPESPNKANKFAILMTDGDQLEIIGTTRTNADATLIEVCNGMRTQGIQVFTVGFSVSAASETLLKRCADRDANFIKASSSTELVNAFERISRMIGDSRARLLY
jgi:Flp pilus assembly protein TadG